MLCESNKGGIFNEFTDSRHYGAIVACVLVHYCFVYENYDHVSDSQAVNFVSDFCRCHFMDFFESWMEFFGPVTPRFTGADRGNPRLVVCARHGRGIGGESPLGALTEGIPHRRGKGAFEKGVSMGAIWKEREP